MILASTLRYLIERATQQVDQWDNVEEGHGPDLDYLRERAETLIDILRDVSELPMPPKESHVSEHAARINDIARDAWLTGGRRPPTMHEVQERIEHYLHEHFMETSPPTDIAEGGD